MFAARNVRQHCDLLNAKPIPTVHCRRTSDSEKSPKFSLCTGHQMPRPHLPVLEAPLLCHVAAPALAVSVVSYAITISLGRVFARKHKYIVNPNQEFLALGASNLFGAMFACFPVGASVPRSSIQEGAGGKTQVVSFVNSLLILIVITCLSPYFEKLPVAILSTIIFISLKKVFLQVKDFKRFWKVSKIDGNIWLVSFLATVIVDVQFGLVIGIIFSLLTLVYQIKKPKTCLLGSIPNTDFYVPLKSYGLASEISSVKVFHFGGPIHFANAEYFRSEVAKKTGISTTYTKKKPKRVPFSDLFTSNGVKGRSVSMVGRAAPSSYLGSPPTPRADYGASDMFLVSTTTCIVFDFSRVTFVDGSSMTTLVEMLKEYMNLGITILVAACSAHVFSMLRKGGIFEILPTTSFFPTVHDAVLHTQRDKKDPSSQPAQPSAPY